MKKIIIKLLIFLLMIIPFIVNASSASISIKCDKTLVIANDTIKCTISMSSSGDINGLQAKYSLGELSYVKFTPTEKIYNTQNMNSNGFTVGNTDGLASSINVGVLEVKVPSSVIENQKFTLKLNELIASNSQYEDVNISDVSTTLRVGSSDATLKSLDVNNFSLNPSFKPSTMIYSIENVISDKVMINAVASNSGAKVSGTGEKTLKYGNNSFDIVVTSETGENKKYTINITRQDTRENNNLLKSLSIDNQVLTPEFNSSIKQYIVNVDSNITSVKINCEVSGSKATFVKKYGPRTINLNYGKNDVQIQVKAENEKINTYKVIINRKDNRDSNNYLSSLELSSGNISFNKETTSYTLSVPNEITKINIKASAESTKAKVSGTGEKTLKEGANKIIIEVKAENERINTYIILIVRAAKGTSTGEVKKFINKLSIKNADIIFDPNIEQYDLELKSGEKLELEYDLPNEITAEEIGNKELTNGGTVQLILTAKNGQIKTYTFNIKEHKKIVEEKKDKPVEKEEKNGKIFWIIVIVVIVIVIVIVILLVSAYIVGKKKNNNSNNYLNNQVNQLPDNNLNIQNSQIENATQINENSNSNLESNNSQNQL